MMPLRHVRPQVGQCTPAIWFTAIGAEGGSGCSPPRQIRAPGCQHTQGTGSTDQWQEATKCTGCNNITLHSANPLVFQAAPGFACQRTSSVPTTPRSHVHVALAGSSSVWRKIAQIKKPKGWQSTPARLLRMTRCHKSGWKKWLLKRRLGWLGWLAQYYRQIGNALD